MSIVDPRPEVRHYMNYWTPEQMHVLDVRPGIKLYLEYVKKHNLFYYLGLIFKIFWVIVKRR